MSIFSKINSNELLMESMSEEITNMLESISNTDSIINSYMVESSTIIHEASLGEGVKTIIAKLIEFIKGLYEKFTTLFMTQSDYISYLLDKYSDKLNKLSDEDLRSIIYQYKDFNIDKSIPVYGQLNNVQKYIDKFLTFKLNHSDIDNFKSKFSTELEIIRGKIVGKQKQIPEYNFLSEVRSIFAGSNEVFMKHMTKSDLDKIIDGITKYKDTKKLIEADKDNILKEYKGYLNTITGMMIPVYGEDTSTATILDDKGQEKRTMDIIEVNRHKTYQSLITSFITQISEAYSVVFKEKMSAIKAKYEMEMSILSQISKLV